MKTKLLLLLLALSMQNQSYACGGLNTPVYAGEIRYKISPSNPLTCTIEVALEFDIAQLSPTDSILINWGDGIVEPIFATTTIPDTAANIMEGNNTYYRHTFAGSHTYDSVSASGFYFISVPNQFRVNDITNVSVGSIPFMPYYIEAQVRVDTVAGFVNESPLEPIPAIAYAYLNSTYHQNIFLNDPNGDSIVFDLLTPLQYHDSSIADYYFPDFYCQQLVGSDTFEINHTTGEISWTTPCTQGIFAIAVIARKYRNGQLLGSIMSDQNIYVSNGSVNSIPKYSRKENIQLYPNPANSFIHLQTDQPLSIIISNVLGETIRKQTLQSSSTIDISDLNSGVYFIRDEKTSAVVKFVKE